MKDERSPYYPDGDGCQTSPSTWRAAVTLLAQPCCGAIVEPDPRLPFDSLLEVQW